MNKIQKKRLLNVAKACRETTHVKDFTMSVFGHGGSCGSPACALGNYAFQRRLQKTFQLIGNDIFFSDGSRVFREDEFDWDDEEHTADWIHIADHFGLSLDECEELFGTSGCDRAITNIQAADYIERFAARQGQEK